MLSSQAQRIVFWTGILFLGVRGVRRCGLADCGMVMLNVGNLIGIGMAVTEMTALKPVHGAALHVIQAFPAMVWLASRLRYPRSWRDASPFARWFSSPGWRHQ